MAAQRAGERPVTQRDVARLANVSQTAVSLVLNGLDGGVSETTRRRVRAAVDELGYIPNPMARGLRGVSTALIAIIARNLHHPPLLAMIESVIVEARKFGFHALVADAGGSARDALNLVALMESRLCDGIILVGDLPDEQVLWKGLSGVDLPTVGLFQGSRRIPLCNISVDNRSGASQALTHLYSLGHRRIAYVDDAGGTHGPQIRKAVYQDFVKSRSIVDFHVPTDGTPAGGQRAFDALMEKPAPPTAIFAATDELALGILSRAAATGRAVPMELSVVGFDDMPRAEYLTPPLTTVRQPIPVLARLAMRELARPERDRPGTDDLEIEPELVVRQSTAPPPMEVTARTSLAD